ncbi:hypothetical protein [Lactiplantibacillus plantarum]|uniref:hypothetical protein n=1 Tax=Lactiplantibacillus plantarum TaxID=1590 RepID=UPI003F529AC7
MFKILSSKPVQRQVRWSFISHSTGLPTGGVGMTMLSSQIILGWKWVASGLE